MYKKTLTALIVLVFFLFLGTTHAQTVEELQDKISAQNDAIANLEAEIASYKKQLTALGKEKDTLSNAIKILNLESQKLGADIRVTEGKITSTNLKLTSLGASIDQAGATIEDLHIAIGKSLRELRVSDTTSLAEMLLAGKDMSDVWHHAGAQVSLRNTMRKRVEELSSTKEILIVDKEAVEEARKQLLVLKSRLGNQQAINRRTKSEHDALLKATNNQETNYAKLVSEKQELKTALEAELRDYESQLEYVLNPNSLPSTGSKTFSWPLNNVYITQLFGKTAASGRLYTTGTHNGIDFRANKDEVLAMANGTVMGWGNADLTCKGASYGIWVLIQYDNGLSSTYGHLSLVTVQKGQRVSRGQVVAYSGASGYATGPHLHVSVYPSDAVNITTFNSRSCPGRTITIPTAAANAYLDPMLYLPK